MNYIKKVNLSNAINLYNVFMCDVLKILFFISYCYLFNTIYYKKLGNNYF